MREKFSEIGEFFRKSRESHPVHWLIIVLAIAIVSGLCGSVFTIFVLGTNPLPKSDDKYDVFVTLFLIFFTILGLLGYGMYIWIRGKLESRLNEMLQKEEQETENTQNLFRARLQRNMGFLFWNLFEVEKKKENGENTPVSKELVRLAIERAEKSLDYAKKLPENEYIIDIYRCKSNWVYFLADGAKIGVELTKKDKERALILSNELFKNVSKQDYPDYYEYQEKCAWALQQLSEKKDEVSKQKAGNIIRELLKDESIPHTRREEIEKKWAPFLEEIEKKSDTANL